MARTRQTFVLPPFGQLLPPATAFFCCRVSFSYIFIPHCSRPPVDNAIYFHIFLMRISNIQNNYWHFLFYSFLAFSVLFSYYYSLVFLCRQAGNVGHNNSSFCRPMRDRADSDTERKMVEGGRGGSKGLKLDEGVKGRRTPVKGKGDLYKSGRGADEETERLEASS